MEESQRGLNEVQKVVRGTCNGADELKKILIGPIGPDVMNGCGWPRKYREEWVNYGLEIKKFWDANKDKESLSRENYIKFRADFFKHCKGGHPKIIVNRLVAMLFPKQFIQVVSEEKVHNLYVKLTRMGAIAEKQELANNNLEARWFDENIAIMNMLRDTLGNLGNDYEFADFGWNLVSHFNELSVNKPNQKQSIRCSQRESCSSGGLTDIRKRPEMGQEPPMTTTPGEISSKSAPITLRNLDDFRKVRGLYSFAKHCIAKMKPHDTWMDAPITNIKHEIDPRLHPSRPANQFFIGPHHVSSADKKIAIDDAIFHWEDERDVYCEFLRAPMPTTRVPARNA